MARGGTSSFLIYRDTVPEEIREAIKERILTSVISGYDEFTACAQYVMAHVASGTIPPQVAKEVRAYLEMILMSISANKITKDPNSTVGDSPMERLAAARKESERIRPALTMTLDADGIPRYEVEAASVKAAVKR